MFEVSGHRERYTDAMKHSGLVALIFLTAFAWLMTRGLWKLASRPLAAGPAPGWRYSAAAWRAFRRTVPIIMVGIWSFILAAWAAGLTTLTDLPRTIPNVLLLVSGGCLIVAIAFFLVDRQSQAGAR